MDCSNCGTEIRPNSSFCYECGCRVDTNIKTGRSIEAEEEPLSYPSEPWLDMWVKPRGTIRAIVNNDPEKYVILLAALSGIAQSLERIAGRSLGDSMPLAAILVIVPIFGAASGLISLYFGGAILRWTGSLLGGRASSTEVRAAIAWSAIPTIVGLALWVPDLALYGGELFTSAAPTIESNPWWLLCSGSVTIILAVWAFILLLKSLGEVHRFSAWRALGAVAIPFFAIVIPLLGCFLIVGVTS